MACPFTTIAAAGGLIVGLKILLFRDRYRRMMWLGLTVVLLGWTVYGLFSRVVEFRIVLEVLSSVLLLGMIARLFWLVRVEKYRIEIPRFLSVPLSKIAPLITHPVSLALKGVLLLMLFLEWTSLYDFKSLHFSLGVGMLLVWLAALFCWTNILRNRTAVQPASQQGSK